MRSPDAEELAARACDDGLWAHDEQAQLHVRVPAGARVLVPQRDEGCDAPPFGAVHVLSACDPGSRGDRSGDEAGHRRLAAAVAGHPSWPAVGTSPDGRHREVSLVVGGLSDDQARGLGLRFGQVAVFGWSGSRWSVLACAGGRRSDLGWHLRVAPCAEPAP